MTDASTSKSAVARALKLKPNEAERESGYRTGTDLVREIADRGDDWVVLTYRGSKHRIAKSGL